MADERLPVRCSAKARLWKAAAIEPSLNRVKSNSAMASSYLPSSISSVLLLKRWSASLSPKQAASPRIVTVAIDRIIRRNPNREVEGDSRPEAGLWLLNNDIIFALRY